MNTLILAIVLLSGYVYVINSSISRYKFKRAEGWGAYFYVAMWGAWFTIASWLMCSLLSILGFFRWAFSWFISHDVFDKEMVERLFPLAPSATFKFVDLKFALFGVVAILLALLWAKVGLPILKRLRRGEHYKLLELEAVVKDHPHEMMLMIASVTKQPVLVTMGSRKFYVGIVVERRFDDGQTDYLSLVPLLSGYRDKDRLTTTVTTNYQTHYEESGILNGSGESRLTLDDFKVLISFDEIDTISYFDSVAYSRFKEREEKDIQQSKNLHGDDGRD
ncbi:hypothetical protein [Erwinia rhapontici]|uniref:hypothetical protein n=1 Tax=Erwinia rhapontici TaxID=55212 RepID=UPI00105DB032|nr:hypothetical protein [Erwinia rhapontici]TDS93426.1 hypothetical protein EDF84_11178 [Erwinia rhapontici]